MTWSIRLKMAVLAPMPRAREKIATKAKAGLLRNMRRPKRSSCHKVSITKSPSFRGSQILDDCVNRLFTLYFSI